MGKYSIYKRYLSLSSACNPLLTSMFYLGLSAKNVFEIPATELFGEDYNFISKESFFLNKFCH